MRWWLLLILCPATALADTIPITALQVHRVENVDRPEMDMDPVEAALIAGEGLSLPDTVLAANADGWFLDDALTGNYAVARIPVEEAGTWLLEGMAYGAVYVNRELRIGNVYGYKDEWESWEPNFDFSVVPVRLEAGTNELIFFGVRWGRMRASLTRARSSLVLNPRDATLPDLVAGRSSDTVGALPILNATGEFITDAELEIVGPGDARSKVPVPPIAPFGIRKAAFPIRGGAVSGPGRVGIEVGVLRAGEVLDRANFELEVKSSAENRRVTFISQIDQSVQYFGHLAARDGSGPKALVLSLHGAAVEAINQSGSYAPLDWAHVVAPTNRRPFGFDWENWGRLDALEVLDLATREFEIDPDRVYLTGHSMGGHGTWHLATLHPDRFAAAGPSAGWITYWSYRRDPIAQDPSPLQEMLARATLTSQTLDKAPNLAPLGLYVLHGADDDNVPPEQSHLMLEVLEGFHRDFVYHEEPGVGHWWDLSDAPGADCVAWAPMFDFFARHRRPGIDEVRDVSFLTPNPGVSAWNHWAGVYRQQRPFEMSEVNLHLDPWRSRVSGTTKNVEVLGLDLAHLDTDSVWIDLDGQAIGASMPEEGPLWLERIDRWAQIHAPDRAKKGAHRNGGFRDVFHRRVQLVVGTQGTPEETAWAWAKARFDAEYLWYQGNASLDVVPDHAFDPAAEPDRNVILYGNADSHLHWGALVDGALDVRGGKITVGDQVLHGTELGLLAIRPRPSSDLASVGIVSGTGIRGFRATDRRPYLRGGFAYPDLTVLGRGAGFFGNDWSVQGGEFIWSGEE